MNFLSTIIFSDWFSVKLNPHSFPFLSLSRRNYFLLQEEHVVVESFVADSKHLGCLLRSKLNDFSLPVFYSVFKLFSGQHDLDDIFDVPLLFLFPFVRLSHLLDIFIARILALDIRVFLIHLIQIHQLDLDLLD